MRFAFLSGRHGRNGGLRLLVLFTALGLGCPERVISKEPPLEALKLCRLLKRSELLV